MIPALALLWGLAGGEAPRLTTWVSAGSEWPSNPDGIRWDDGELGGLLRKGPWWSSLAIHGLRRFDLDDGEVSASFGRGNRSFGWEAGAGRGFEEIFLPTWALRTAVHAGITANCDASLSQKTSIHKDFTVVHPEAGVNLRLGRFDLGVRGNIPFADGDALTVGWRIGSDVSWSDATATGVALGSWSEAESAPRGGMLRTRVTSAAFTARHRISSTTLRANTTWTRQGSIHDRIGAGLGIAHDFEL